LLDPDGTTSTPTPPISTGLSTAEAILSTADTASFTEALSPVPATDGDCTESAEADRDASAGTQPDGGPAADRSAGSPAWVSAATVTPAESAAATTPVTAEPTDGSAPTSDGAPLAPPEPTASPVPPGVPPTTFAGMSGCGTHSVSEGPQRGGIGPSAGVLGTPVEFSFPLTDAQHSGPAVGPPITAAAHPATRPD